MFILPELPYAYDALSSVISDKTMHFHHDKHHAAYVKTTNELVEKSKQSYDSLESLVKEAGKSNEKKLFNNAAQAWNHAFFWVAMSPARQQAKGDVEAAVRTTFGDVAKLKEAFVTEGAGHFGSGWVWLVSDSGGKLKVVSTHDAADMLSEPDLTPLLVCDLWEHAYYLDYQNDRKKFLESWFDALPNWDFAASQFAARAGNRGWTYPAPTRSTVSA